MLPMTVLLSLVPLFLIFHVICIAQVRKWSPAAETGRASRSLGYSAV